MAGGPDRLIEWVRFLFPKQRGRPRGATRYRQMDEALIGAILKAKSSESLNELIRVNVAMMADPKLGASPRSIRQRLRKKTRSL